MKIIYPELSYVEALELSGLLTLYDRREAIAANLFDEICPNKSHSLHKLSTLWENKEHLFVQSVKPKDTRIIVFF